MKRTTIVLSPSLLKAVQELAYKEGWTMRKAINDLVKAGLKTRSRKRIVERRREFEWHTQSLKAKLNDGK